jgi:hypothetical protein
MSFGSWLIFLNFLFLCDDVATITVQEETISSVALKPYLGIIGSKLKTYL